MTTATTIPRPSYTYTYVEPHPSLPSSNKLSTGRGGAGNATLLCPKNTTAGPTASGPASLSTTVAPRRIAVGGRGGAGNVKRTPTLTVSDPSDNQLERDERHDHVGTIEGSDRIWHYGRGGQGNVLRSKSRSSGSDSSSLASRRNSVISSISAESDRGGEKPRNASRSSSFVGRVADKLRRGSNENAN